MTQTPKTGVPLWLKGLMLKRLPHMITCTEFEEFVVSYLDNDMPPRQKSKFDWHIRLCRECRDYLAAYQRARELGIEMLSGSNDSVPEDVPEDLIEAILAARKD